MISKAGGAVVAAPALGWIINQGRSEENPMTTSTGLIANYLASGNTFSDSTEQAHRQFMRSAVRRAKISNNKKAVAEALLNLWFRHRHSNCINPSRRKVAKMAHVSEPTVARFLKEMREAGALIVVGYGKGGKKRDGSGIATHYQLDLKGLIQWMGYKLPEERPGQLVEVAQNVVPFETFREVQERRDRRRNDRGGEENVRRRGHSYRIKMIHNISNNCNQSKSWDFPSQDEEVLDWLASMDRELFDADPE